MISTLGRAYAVGFALIAVFVIVLDVALRVKP